MKAHLARGMQALSLFLVLATLAACGGGGSPGGGGGGGGGGTTTYTIGGSVSGLAGTVVLQNNVGDDLSVAASDAFHFNTAIATGGVYSVTVKTQPANQICTVASGSGTVGASSVTSVVVTCVNNAVNSFSVGNDSNNVSAYAINPTTGALTEISPPVASGVGSSSVTVDPSGRFAYVANSANNNVSAYAINPVTGALLTPAPLFPAGMAPLSIAITATVQ